MPDILDKILMNWQEISSGLHTLFARAPSEALIDTNTLLARLTLNGLDNWAFPEHEKALLSERAEAILSRHSDDSILDEILEGAQQLTGALDRAVELCQMGSSPLTHSEAEAVARSFLQNSRSLDRELSSIPKRLSNQFVVDIAQG